MLDNVDQFIRQKNIRFNTAMSNGVHQNMISRCGKAESGLEALNAEATQHSDTVKKNNFMTSNEIDEGNAFVEPSRKRTRSTNHYVDGKRNCKGTATADSKCKSLATVEELANESQQNFDHQEHASAGTNGVSSKVEASYSTSAGGLTTNGHTPDHIIEKTRHNIKQHGRQSAISKSATSYNNESYAYGQSSFHDDIPNDHGVSFSPNTHSPVLLESHSIREYFSSPYCPLSGKII